LIIIYFLNHFFFLIIKKRNLSVGEIGQFLLALVVNARVSNQVAHVQQLSLLFDFRVLPAQEPAHVGKEESRNEEIETKTKLRT
jgi:hypothetical protein